MNMPRYAVVNTKLIDDAITKEVRAGKLEDYAPILPGRMGTFVSNASLGRADRIWFKDKFYKVDIVFHQEAQDELSIGRTDVPVDAILLVVEEQIFKQTEIPEAFKPEKWPTRG
jgi:hypothetical protein